MYWACFVIIRTCPYIYYICFIFNLQYNNVFLIKAIFKLLIVNNLRN